MMIVLTAIFAATLLVSPATAFVPSQPRAFSRVKQVVFSTTEEPPITTTAVHQTLKEARARVLVLANQLKGEEGVFVIDKTAKKELDAAVEDLESLVDPVEYDAEQFLGDWSLLCTTAVSRAGIDTSSWPDPIQAIRKTVRQAANKYLAVQQRIRSMEDNGVVDRIDHVLEYNPPEQLKEVLDNLPTQLTELNINPLHVSKSKIVLVHKVTIDKNVAPFVTTLALTGIVLNVAGTSTFLDPNGKDVAGLKLPLGEFINTGNFKTTYMDDKLRISRGKQGIVNDQLRVFVRAEEEPEPAVEEEVEEEEVYEAVDATIEEGDIGDDLTPSA
jgi:hypothetical protein